MGRTTVSGKQIKDSGIQKEDLDITTPGHSVITSVTVGSGLSYTHTGADAGTGDVVVSLTPVFKNSGLVTVDFGSFNQEDTTSITKVVAPWIKSSSQISFYIEASNDHDPEDVIVEGIHFYIGNIIPNNSFCIIASCPQGTWGAYNLRWQEI